jgi:microcystin-dependent protein
MSEPFIGEIRMFAGNFAPQGWAFCDGQLLSISQNLILFSLLGTSYGGDGRTTFALPDLRGRIPIHAGSAPDLTRRKLGEIGGQEVETLKPNQLPPHKHRHLLQASTDTAMESEPKNAVLSQAQNELYVESDPNVSMHRDAIGPIGIAPEAVQPHDNMMPFCCVNFIIALFGISPSRS